MRSAEGIFASILATVNNYYGKIAAALLSYPIVRKAVLGVKLRLTTNLIAISPQYLLGVIGTMCTLFAAGVLIYCLPANSIENMEV